jgi:hypothetical protein
VGDQGRGPGIPAEPRGDDGTARHAKPDGGQPGGPSGRPADTRRATVIGADDVEAVRVIEN